KGHLQASSYENRVAGFLQLEKSYKNELRNLSYIDPDVEQEIDLYDLYFEECGLLETFLDIQKQYEDGKL
ncbi:MAG: hypothetical protein P8X79_22470, partial [Reinekea sp.]